MSHEIFELDRPFYGSRQPAWHGLGTVLDGQLTSEQALAAAHLDWSVHLEACRSEHGITIPDAYATVRTDLDTSDNRRFLGVVGKRYNPIQNSEAFRLADALVDASGAKFETAGSLRNGRIVWMLAQLPEPQTVKGDRLANYLLLRTSHDGTSALECLLTSVRVVCWNTLTAALGRSSGRGPGPRNRVKVRHTKSARVNITEARRILGIASAHFEQHRERLDKLADVKVDTRFVDAFANAMYPDRENQNNTRARNARDEIISLYGGRQVGADQDAVRGTAYGLYNAFTEYLDHNTAPQCTNRTQRQVAETRFESTLYGGNASKRQVAFDLISRATGVDGNGKGLAVQVLEDAPSGRPDVDALLAGIDL
jgi:phage/plasmid-like protein (TIGR03299 family)